MSYEPKTAKDMEKLAEELLQAIFKLKIVSVDEGGVFIQFSQAIPAISHHLLDAYNEGYDACIIETSLRKFKG